MITLFLPLSGRKKCWRHLSSFLDKQSIDKKQCSLVLLDTSNDEMFHLMLKRWVDRCDYSHVQLNKMLVSTHHLLSELPRMENFSEVNHVMCKIYNYAKDVLQGEHLFVIEDDVIPPLNAFDELKKHLSDDVASISGAYKQKKGRQLWTAWKNVNGSLIETKGIGVEQVASTGFGCLVMKADDYLTSDISWRMRDTQWPWGYDMEFFSKQTKKILINWDVQCQHLEESNLDGLLFQ